MTGGFRIKPNVNPIVISLSKSCYEISYSETLDHIYFSMNELAPMRVARIGHCSCYINKKLYVFGGVTEDNEKQENLADVDVYDVKSKQWSSLAPMHKKRSRFGLYYSNTDFIYAFGGFMECDDESIHNSIERYCISLNQWDIYKS